MRFEWLWVPVPDPTVTPQELERNARKGTTQIRRVLRMLLGAGSMSGPHHYSKGLTKIAFRDQMALIGSDMMPDEAYDVFDHHKNKQSGLSN